MHRFHLATFGWSIALLLIFCAAAPPAQAQENSANPMLALLQERVARDPTRADCWRLLGRIHHQQGRLQEAEDAFRRTLSLQSGNAAAHFDLGELLLQRGDWQAATWHHRQVMALAPESKYASQLVSRGFASAPGAAQPTNIAALPSISVTMPHEVPPAEVELAGYEIQTFDGADDLDQRLNQLESDAIGPHKRWRTFVELGALYNTNVALTPISRELAGEESASFQGFLSPELEWMMINRGPWRSGPLLRGYFTVNEEAFREFDLASFMPGVFLERDFGTAPETTHTARLDYVYSLDLLNGNRFGDRHAVTTSLTTILPEADVIYSYLTVSLSDFADDGADPTIDSLDGPALTAGTSRFFQTGWWALPTWSLGTDLTWADTEGADFRYLSANAHTEVTFQLTECLQFAPRAGIGYRWYNDFTGPVSRDEFTYRLSGRLRWQLTEQFALSAVAGYDRFASDNKEFDTDRFETGLVATFLR